jgi:hypothetical protein
MWPVVHYGQICFPPLCLGVAFLFFGDLLLNSNGEKYGLWNWYMWNPIKKKENRVSVIDLDHNFVHIM